MFEIPINIELHTKNGMGHYGIKYDSGPDKMFTIHSTQTYVHQRQIGLFLQYLVKNRENGKLKKSVHDKEVFTHKGCSVL